MEVILLERVGKLGGVGDVVKVKNGFGRNFLLPQKKALRATHDNKKVFEAKRAEIEAENAASRATAQKLAGKMGGVSVTLIRQASEDGKLYGSVTTRDIAEGLKAQGHDIDRKQISLAATVKNTGSFEAELVLHPEVVLNLPVHVMRNEAESVEEAPEDLRAPSEEASEETEGHAEE